MRADGKGQIQFHAALLPHETPEYRCAASIRFEQHDPTSLEVELLWLGDEEERRKLMGAIRAIDPNRFQLHAIDGSDFSVDLLGLDGWEVSLVGMTLRPSAMEVGIDRKVGSEPVDTHFIVRLQPGGILVQASSHIRNYTGGIEVNAIDEGNIIVESDLGPIEALEAYEYVDSTAFGDKVTHQVQRSTLMGKMTLEPGESLRGRHEALLEEVHVICQVLSLCYRQPVDAFEIEYLARPDQSGGRTPLLYRRKWSSTRTKRSGDELVHASALVDGGLSQLVAALRSHPESHAIRGAISFLAASYDAFLETAYFTAFSAMESVVNAVLSDDSRWSMAPSAWKKVQPALRKTISELENDGVIPAATAADMREKLAELRRISLASRLAKVTEKFPFKTTDLWPGEGFEKGMQRAAALRNGLFHDADTTELNEMNVNLIRIQIFTERLILAVLRWPEEKVWVWNDQILKRIRPSDAPE